MLETPVLNVISPKTITVIGKLNKFLNLSKIFDIIPLFEDENFKVLTYKHEGLKRELASNGVVTESDTEFKNSITVELLDKECEKIRSVKIHCNGIHICGNRSLSRAEQMIDVILTHITDTQLFIQQTRNLKWEDLVKHEYYKFMVTVIRSIIPPEADVNNLPYGLTENIKKLFVDIIDTDGGLFTGINSHEVLKLSSVETVMINFSYSIEDYLNRHFKASTKEMFLSKFINGVKETENKDFEVYIYYDSLTSSMGWSGSVPIKLIHRETKIEQWITLQMRRGTIINSGRSFKIMQLAVNYIYSILNSII